LENTSINQVADLSKFTEFTLFTPSSRSRQNEPNAARMSRFHTLRTGEKLVKVPENKGVKTMASIRLSEGGPV
jgi:hypothetical protein